MNESFVLTAVFMAVFAAGTLVATVRHAKRLQPPPMHPEFLREAFARQKQHRASGGEKAAAVMMMLGLAVPGVLLLALASSGLGRAIGGVLLGWIVFQLVFGIWYRRGGRLERAQQRALAKSEAFWSQPDAEERAKEMRRFPVSRRPTPPGGRTSPPSAPPR